MSEEVETLYGMKGNVVVKVYVKDLKERPNVFIVKLPFRPHRGDYINLEGQPLEWCDLEGRKTISDVAREAGLLESCSTIQVDEVVIVVCYVERDESIVRAYATMRIFPHS